LVIPGTNLETSRFIFGTSSLMRVGVRRSRRRLLDAAIDNGFVHFDTAPYYGFGVAERDLAPVLKANPGARVTTKVGIYSPGGEAQSAASVLLRKAGARIFPSLARPITSFALNQAKQCLEASLRRLGREHIDIYMLHEPELHQLDARQWLEWLESVRSSGKIGRFGVALTARRLQPFLACVSPLADLTQVLDTLAEREADVLPMHDRPLQITYGYISGARAQGDNTPVAELLRVAVRRNPHGPIIVSTTRLDRVGQYAQIPEAGGA
jgi:aryl-alcohol dehydrogenase-like predicted oxidoreductase